MHTARNKLYKPATHRDNDCQNSTHTLFMFQFTLLIGVFRSY